MGVSATLFAVALPISLGFILLALALHHSPDE
jgi:hypothetical protein